MFSDSSSIAWFVTAYANSIRFFLFANLFSKCFLISPALLNLLLHMQIPFNSFFLPIFFQIFFWFLQYCLIYYCICKSHSILSFCQSIFKKCVLISPALLDLLLHMRIPSNSFFMTIFFVQYGRQFSIKAFLKAP